MVITKATPSHHVLLTEITKAAKAFWGYSKEQLAIWDEDLTVSPDYISQNQVFILFNNDQIIGYYSFLSENTEVVKLDNMFLFPEKIGKGFGKIMMTDFLARVKNLGYKKVILDSEPFAKDFYLKKGFKEIDRKESSIPGRYLPVMELVITLS